MPRDSSRLVRSSGAGVLGVLLLLALTGGALAVEPAECELWVEPKTGPIGTQFTLSGEGYTPTQLTLATDSGRETTIDLDLGGADPFSIPIRSEPGDEGRWTATVSSTDGDCTASATFTVTLLSTDFESGSLAPGDGRFLPAIYLLAVVLAVSVAAFLAGPRRAGPRRAR